MEDMEPSDSAIHATHMWVSPTYFSTLGISLLAGRLFTGADMKPLEPGSVGAAVISESLARRLFGQHEALGHRVTTGAGMAAAQLSYRVVGIVRDSKWNTLVGEDDSGPLFYRPLADDGMRSTLTVVTRSRQPRATQRAVEQALAEVAPTVPVYLSTTLAAQVDGHLSNQRLFAIAASSCTVLALLLAGIGLYALISFSVVEQRKEIGIRIALGARAQRILGLVIRQGAQLGGIGLVLGLAGAATASRFIASRLYGVRSFEPTVYVLGGVLLLALVLLASFVPARAATKVDPMLALKSE
jgi:ABC-type antimicrobial peptide transport system permease subunit